MYTDMEAEIHHLEQEAYCAVLRAFKAQSNAITWVFMVACHCACYLESLILFVNICHGCVRQEKEGLITELRKELRVSDDEHRELLTRVNSEDIIDKIRVWRDKGGHQAARLTSSQNVNVFELLSSPTISASRKKQKTSQSHGQPFPGLSSMKSMKYPSTGPVGSRQFTRSSSGPFVEAAEAETSDSLVGRKVWTRWPEDNSFYEAVITYYNPAEGRHALVYDIHTPNETWEWVDLKEISPEDICWEDPGPSGRRAKKSTSHTSRKRGPTKSQSKKELTSQNGIGKAPDDLELLNTDTLVKEVERVFNASEPDPFELEKARKILKDHEQALVDAIQRLAYASDGESADREHTFLHSRSMDG
nr:protein EMSY-LIKE 1-like isoform X3 [Malus domestica]